MAAPVALASQPSDQLHELNYAGIDDAENLTHPG